MSAAASLREIFEAALALPAQARDAFLDAHCADAGMRAEVARMLDADSDDADPLSSSAVDRLADEIGECEPAQMLPPGSRVGAFDLIEVIGEGGSSTVFRAERTFEGAMQPVALKLLRQSLFSPEAQRRFRREQQALIRLRHPNIARMIEGGVTSAGLPYLALELIDGEPITDHARRHRLDLRARVRLFVVVCRAVDAAHRALIVHRDLKPSNVLVDREGEVKLLDFGVAKLLAENDERHTQMPAFTPAYAAPEQWSAGTVTTATDVYALGVLLGELLTGERLAGDGERTPSSRVVATTQPALLPAPPPEVRRFLRGDLDAIVMKAVQPDAEQRYTSAGTLADDLERFLDGRPVHARAPSRWYRAHKFVTRHRGAVATALAFVVAILAALGVALWQAHVARFEAARANAEARHAVAIRDFLVSVFDSARSELPREKRPTVEELVDDASARMLRDATLPEPVRVDLLLTLAGVDNQLGAYAQAQALLDRATPIIDLAPSSDPALRARRLRAQALLGQARPAEARALLEPLRDAASQNAAGVEALVVLGNALSGENRADEAQPIFAQARAIAQTLPDGADALVQRVDVSRVESLVYAQKFADGLALADATWTRWKAQAREPSRDILNLLAAISVAAEGTGDVARAETAYRDAIEVAERLYVRPHPDTAWVIGVYGSFLVAAARFDEAEPYVERALSMRRALLGDAHPDTLNAIAAKGRLRSGQMRRSEAREIFSEGVAICERENVRHNVCPRLLGSLAQILLAEGEVDEASRAATKAVAMQRALTGAESPQMIGVLSFLARAQVRQRAFGQALATTGEALRIAERAGSSDSKEARYTRFQRALALSGLDRNDEALALVAGVVAEQKAKTPDEKTSLFSMLALQARSLAKAGRGAEAKAAAQEALAIERKPKPLDAAMVDELERLASTRAITASKRD